MKINRRTVLTTAIAFGVIGTRGWTATTAEFEGFTIETLSDGFIPLPRGMLLVEPHADEIASALDEAGIGDSVESPINVTLLRRDDALVLFDAGSGPDFLPSAGELPAALDAAGVAVEDVTHVVFTHAHPDHIWGVLDDFDEPMFPNARHLIGAAERDYWMDPATLDSLPEDRKSFAVGAQRRIEALGDALETFADGDEIIPGVVVQATPGHTPGHVSFVVDDTVMVVGDAIGNGHLAFSHPELPAGADHDLEQGIATRTALLEQLAGSGMVMIGYHLPEGGIGVVETDGEAYRFVPR